MHKNIILLLKKKKGYGVGLELDMPTVVLPPPPTIKYPPVIFLPVPLIFRAEAWIDVQKSPSSTQTKLMVKTTVAIVNQSLLFMVSVPSFIGILLDTSILEKKWLLENKISPTREHFIKSDLIGEVMFLSEDSIYILYNSLL
jgi:hypothetical protein